MKLQFNTFYQHSIGKKGAAAKKGFASGAFGKKFGKKGGFAKAGGAGFNKKMGVVKTFGSSQG